jgi:hypothetical protein
VEALAEEFELKDIAAAALAMAHEASAPRAAAPADAVAPRQDAQTRTDVQRPRRTYRAVPARQPHAAVV